MLRRVSQSPFQKQYKVNHLLPPSLLPRAIVYTKCALVETKCPPIRFVLESILTLSLCLPPPFCLSQNIIQSTSSESSVNDSQSEEMDRTPWNPFHSGSEVPSAVGCTPHLQCQTLGFNNRYKEIFCISPPPLHCPKIYFCWFLFLTYRLYLSFPLPLCLSSCLSLFPVSIRMESMGSFPETIRSIPIIK